VLKPDGGLRQFGPCAAVFLAHGYSFVQEQTALPVVDCVMNIPFFGK